MNILPNHSTPPSSRPRRSVPVFPVLADRTAAAEPTLHPRLTKWLSDGGLTHVATLPGASGQGAADPRSAVMLFCRPEGGTVSVGFRHDTGLPERFGLGTSAGLVQLSEELIELVLNLGLPREVRWTRGLSARCALREAVLSFPGGNHVRVWGGGEVLSKLGMAPKGER